MPGPVAFGVHKALEKQRAHEKRKLPIWTPGQGWFVFVLATICLSWLAAGALSDHWHPQSESLSVRLWWASIYYALTMGWQPIVAAWIARSWRDKHPIDPGMHWPRRSYVGLAMVLALGLAAAAMAVARLLGEPLQVSPPFSGHAESALAAVAAMLVLCVQAVSEEYGWRGAPLKYAIERWGRPGLVVHGVMWGVWYAPLFVLSSSSSPLETAGGFVVTCMLLGIVFGWLRLRSESLLPSAIANALLTIVAGLPLLLHDGSVGIRDAVFRWPGWPVIGVLATILLFTRGTANACRQP